jgi:hypothetical protein
MAVSITATLTGSTSPQKVSVVVAGLTVGDTYDVAGVWSGGSWAVRGGSGVATSTQVVLVDVASPVNVPVTYQVIASSGSATSSAVTVGWDDGGESKYLLQSLDGSISVGFTWLDDAGPREVPIRSNLLEVAGRRGMVAALEVPGFDTGTLTARLTAAGSLALRDLLVAGRGLALLRTDGAVRDLPAVDFVALTRAPSELFGTGTDRTWSLSYQVIGDPEPSTVVPLSTWDDFDAAYALSTWSAFDSEWTGLTWDLFDRTDWTTH